MKNQVRVLGSVSPYCKNGSNCSGFLIENNDKILLDCGPGITSRMNIPDDLEGLTIIISHLHKDHYADLFAIGYASLCYHRMGLLKQRIKVYIPEVPVGSKEYLDYQLIMNLEEAYFDVITYNERDMIHVGENVISFYKTHHSVTNYSCKIQNIESTIVYTGDMGFRDVDAYADFISNADCFICESTYLDSDNVTDMNHLHAKEAGYIASLGNVKMLMLTHFWPEHNKIGYLQEAMSYFQNVIVADENKVIDLNLINQNTIKVK